MPSNSRYKSKNDADEAVSVVSLTSSSGGYINGRNSANLEDTDLQNNAQNTKDQETRITLRTWVEVMNEERTGTCLRQVEHIGGHLRHRYFVTLTKTPHC